MRSGPAKERPHGTDGPSCSVHNIAVGGSCRGKLDGAESSSIAKRILNFETCGRSSEARVQPRLSLLGLPTHRCSLLGAVTGDASAKRTMQSANILPPLGSPRSVHARVWIILCVCAGSFGGGRMRRSKFLTWVFEGFSQSTCARV